MGTNAAPITFPDRANIPTVLTGTATGTFITLVQGTGEDERIGRKYIIKSFWWKIALESTTAGPSTDFAVIQKDASDVYRIILYVDKQTNAAAAAGVDLLEGSATDSYLAFRELVNKGRFVVLKDITRVLTSTVQATHTGSTFSYTTPRKKSFLTIYWRGNIPIEANSTTAAITNLRTNNICAMIMSENGNIKMESRYRIRYIG